MKWKILLVHSKIVLILTQDMCTLCAKHAIVSEVLLGAPELLGDVGQVEACFSPFGDRVNLDARLMHGLHQTHHMLENQFECT